MRFASDKYDELFPRPVEHEEIETAAEKFRPTESIIKGDQDDPEIPDQEDPEIPDQEDPEEVDQEEKNNGNG